MKIETLQDEHATIIANQWHYPAEYSFYDLQEDPEDYAEILDPKARGNQYYQVIDDNQLVGYFVLEESQGVLNLGLGLRPDLTGQGFGSSFLNLILAYARENYPVQTIRLGVAAFNLRAQKLYQKAGFHTTREYLQETNGGHYPFIEMERDLW